MKKKSQMVDKSAIYDLITNSLIDENRYYHCEIPKGSFNNGDSITEAISNACWVSAVDDPITKNEQRGVLALTQLHATVNSGQATIVGICDCCVNRTNVTETEIDTDYPECDKRVGDIALQMTEKEYKKLLLSALETGKDEISMPSIIVKCKTLPKVPKCDKCDGRGRVSCDYCHGYGNGECPDCKGDGQLFPNDDFGKEHQFYNKIGYVQRYQIVLSMDDCPSCNGTGEFKCDVCDGSGEIECQDCKGSGLTKNGKKAQKVTRLTEKYNINRRGILSMPDDCIIELDSNFVNEIIAKTNAYFVANDKNGIVSEILGEQKVSDCNQYVRTTIQEIVQVSNIFALNVAFENLDMVYTLKFEFKGEEYTILVVGYHAFAERLPELSFLDKLFKKY